MNKRLIYKNNLSNEKDIEGWVQEGHIKYSFDDGLILENGHPEELGDHAHWTMWLPEEFPSHFEMSWEFLPLREPGLCMIFFSATSKDGQSIFSHHLNRRTGYYPQYHSGDINTYHISYFRHKYESERAFRTCNLRKSAGFHFITQGADPLPAVEDAKDYYRLTVIKRKNRIVFKINELTIFEWEDDGCHGPALGKGWIGFRQMAPMKAKYRNIRVYELL
ncbi:MAG TPA: YesU family protein [Candidatus Jeotgalibaca merdavium]|uniref:YesU family protein n=1 Tax=Candidatus Jeotgalibaca merdavium TaxID=2838627 RepID=A0A9D2I1T5_9LACT|nr:YesU family protein [Candidatus Jeotgalibaca merdavium]